MDQIEDDPPRIRPARPLHPNTLNVPTSCRDVHQALVESEMTEIVGGLECEGQVRFIFLTAVTSQR